MIVTNTMFQSAPWADAMFAIDAPWWKYYGAHVRETFAGLCYSMAKHPGVRRAAVPAFQNSGCGALTLAAERGAERIILVGYDCQKTDGKVHSHGDHPEGLGNAGSMPLWPERFAQCAEWLRRRGVTVVNCSRATALSSFKRGDLETELNA